jgi:hypothetical protein
MLGTFVDTDGNTKANNPFDNVGVQYGLKALLDGTIEVDQFLDLNEHIGSYDVDGNLVAERVPAPEDAVEAAYAKGRVLHGGGGLLSVPMITANPYTDLSVDIHDRFRAFAVRDRMARESGARPTNDPLWTRQGTSIAELVDPETLPIVDMIGLLDQWLDDLDRDEAPRPADDDVDGWQGLLARTRPKGLADDCITPDGDHLVGDDVYDAGHPCAEAYPVHGDPRTAAGVPQRDDVIKCTLRPSDPGAYADISFTDAQAARLATVFPDGVCDYDEPGVGQVALQGTWLDYSH